MTAVKSPGTGPVRTAPRPEVAVAVEAAQAWIDRRQRALVRNLHACGQSPAQLHVLGMLRDIREATVSQLASHLAISPPSASAIIDRMVDAGLLDRVRSEADRRVVSVSLSPAGESALERAIGGRREMLEKVFSQLTDDELRDTVRVITRLEEAIVQVKGAPPGG